jgi:hypothetical protein
MRIKPTLCAPNIHPRWSKTVPSALSEAARPCRLLYEHSSRCSNTSYLRSRPGKGAVC